MIVDRLTAESQCIGGIIMGLGFALYEHRILDRNTAQMVNPNMEFYLLPGMSDIPTIDVTLVDQAGPRRRRSRRASHDFYLRAAVANAVANAIGVREKAPADARGRAHGARTGARRRDAVKPFAYVKAAGEKQAVAALAAPGGKALPLAGGMDLIGLMKDYVAQPDRLVSVKELDATISKAGNGGLRIGAAMTLADLAANADARRIYPALTDAAAEVGSPQIRNVGTVGGT